MRDMDYEKAWKWLRRILKELKGHSARIAKTNPGSFAERDRASGGEIMAMTALKCMDDIEEKMTTAGEDDGQMTQD